MNISKNSSRKLIVNAVEKLTLPFSPICDLNLNLSLPYLPGSKVIKVNFNQEATISPLPKK